MDERYAREWLHEATREELARLMVESGRVVAGITQIRR
jgi:hypothetical protein